MLAWPHSKSYRKFQPNLLGPYSENAVCVSLSQIEFGVHDDVANFNIDRNATILIIDI